MIAQQFCQDNFPLFKAKSLRLCFSWSSAVWLVFQPRQPSAKRNECCTVMVFWFQSLRLDPWPSSHPGFHDGLPTIFRSWVVWSAKQLPWVKQKQSSSPLYLMIVPDQWFIKTLPHTQQQCALKFGFKMVLRCFKRIGDSMFSPLKYRVMAH